MIDIHLILFVSIKTLNLWAIYEKVITATLAGDTNRNEGDRKQPTEKKETKNEREEKYFFLIGSKLCLEVVCLENDDLLHGIFFFMLCHS